ISSAPENISAFVVAWLTDPENISAFAVAWLTERRRQRSDNDPAVLVPWSLRLVTGDVIFEKPFM
ncbi:hypothetical protein Bpfe_028073, partial [Biomphalaria pfeifferi]